MTQAHLPALGGPCKLRAFDSSSKQTKLNLTVKFQPLLALDSLSDLLSKAVRVRKPNKPVLRSRILPALGRVP